MCAPPCLRSPPCIRYARIQVSRNPCIQKSKYPKVQIAKYPDIQISRYSHIQTSKYSDILMSRYQVFRYSEFRNEKENKKQNLPTRSERCFNEKLDVMLCTRGPQRRLVLNFSNCVLYQNEMSAYVCFVVVFFRIHFGRSPQAQACKRAQKRAQACNGSMQGDASALKGMQGHASHLDMQGHVKKCIWHARICTLMQRHPQAHKSKQGRPTPCTRTILLQVDRKRSEAMILLVSFISE